LTALGSPVPSLGDYPGALAFNDAGTLLCAINNGVDTNVVCYRVLDGGRRMVPGTPRRIFTNQTSNPPSGPSNTIGTVIFTPDQQHVITTVKGTNGKLANVPGYLATWAIDAHSRDILSHTSAQAYIPVPGGVPFSLTQIPGRRLAYIGSDLAEGANIYDFSKGFGDVQIQTMSIPGAAANCWSVYSSKTKTYFISDIGASILNEVAVTDGLRPTLVRVRGYGNSRG
jgi:hypothetical protein